MVILQSRFTHASSFVVEFWVWRHSSAFRAVQEAQRRRFILLDCDLDGGLRRFKQFC
jgi:hypothetical protein